MSTVVDTLADEDMLFVDALAPTSTTLSRNAAIGEAPVTHHDQTEVQQDPIDTPRSIHSTASDTLVCFGHPLRYSPTHSNPEGFSPYNNSSGSSQPLSSPCLRLTPYIHLDSPPFSHSSPQSQIGHNGFSWNSLPRAIPINKQLKAILSLPSSSLTSSRSSSKVAFVRKRNEALYEAPGLRPDQLGFSQFGFNPLPLTAPPLQRCKQVSKGDVKDLFAEVSGLCETMDSETRAKFAADLSQLVQGSDRYDEGYADGYRKGREEAEAREREESSEDSSRN